MVNIPKRMRALKPKLLTIRNGPGAAILPPLPAPQLIHVHLRSPPAFTRATASDRGARDFWRKNLRRLKFHNPALPITVDYAEADPNAPVTLSLKFEHKDPAVLEAIGGNVAALARGTQKRKNQRQVSTAEITEDEKEALARQQSPNFREAPVDWKKSENSLDTQEAVEEAAIKAEVTPQDSPEITEELSSDLDVSTLPSDAVVLSPASNAGSPLYIRSVTLGLRDRSAENIWNWFSDRTRCTVIPTSAEDNKEMGVLSAFFARSAIDRQQVKEGREAVRKEKADLAKARGEANKLKEEAI